MFIEVFTPASAVHFVFELLVLLMDLLNKHKHWRLTNQFST